MIRINGLLTNDKYCLSRTIRLPHRGHWSPPLHLRPGFSVSTQAQSQAQTIEQQLERLQVCCHRQRWAWPEHTVFRDKGYIVGRRSNTLPRPAEQCVRRPPGWRDRTQPATPAPAGALSLVSMPLIDEGHCSLDTDTMQQAIGGCPAGLGAHTCDRDLPRLPCLHLSH